MGRPSRRSVWTEPEPSRPRGNQLAQPGDTFAVQDTLASVDDLRKVQVGRALVYVGRPGQRPFPDGTIVRPRADNPNGARIFVRSETDASIDFAFSDELSVTSSQQLVGR